METLATSEGLRRMVLSSPDGYSDGIEEFMRSVLGYSTIGWVNVHGNAITVYLGGQEPDRPPVADTLTRDLGGRVTIGSSPVDHGWYEWRWTAPLEPRP